MWLCLFEKGKKKKKTLPLLRTKVTFTRNSLITFISNSVGVASHITLDFLSGDELISPPSWCLTVFSLPQGVNLTRQTWVGLPSIWSLHVSLEGATKHPIGVQIM